VNVNLADVRNVAVYGVMMRIAIRCAARHNRAHEYRACASEVIDARVAQRVMRCAIERAATMCKAHETATTTGYFLALF
jgi:hypothetical protein